MCSNFVFFLLERSTWWSVHHLEKGVQEPPLPKFDFVTIDFSKAEAKAVRKVFNPTFGIGHVIWHFHDRAMPKVKRGLISL